MKIKIVAIVLAIVAMISVAAFFFTKKSSDDAPINTNFEPVIYSYEQSEYTLDQSLKVIGQNGETFMPTDFDGIYYNAKLDGSVTFYEFSNGEMLPCSIQPKELKTTFSASFQDIGATVYYIEKDGKVCGYGIFTSDNDTSVNVYAYAFLKIINKPSAYGDGYLLLADFEKENFLKANKTYSEIYSLDISGGKTSKLVSENTRLVGADGALRNDWTMLTEHFLKNLGNNKCFISSRYYTAAERGQRADIMQLSNAYRPEIIVKDILGVWFVGDEYGMHYLKKSDKGFDNILNNGSENVLSSFEGNLFTDYFSDGNFLLNKKTLVLTDLITGAASTLKNIDVSAASGMSVSPDGKKLVIYYNGEINENGAVVQKLVYYTTDGSADTVTYKEPLLFVQSADFVWIDSDTVMSVRALEGSGAQVGSVIYTY